MMRALSASRIKTREFKVHLQHLLSQSPSAVVGHAYYVFDVP